ncbi:aminotransferase class III-fold pyridoxal phosphate-dependent enzyme [Streptomyces antimycoticus]|uniref:Aminotransferase class III-fold pyridoxal phosphate-dependent enzyme n=2 Tax=Streptomyces violaceusniger group TaxID=2839105 RepID=A0ABD5JCK3_9ACTN|nr:MULTISPECIES: aminotransferase class III-fold pyridoxal phosphate-dependent enzyme [Streptomyces]KUL65072.1 acetylornithine aminotransferase [Streptomyces violaceusniger]MEE4585961.1 aminotransferase class III-fold pyridoxal phosphate-dependent enzyme [Streptomyces sp. DSM 41602]RSS48995.1 aminotransferase class III-fold pyridoxal phosphate-dependent enzyme [Streptomyces sp. WAC05858]
MTHGHDSETTESWFDRTMHMDQYGTRLPFGSLGAKGLTHRFVELSGADRGRELNVLDASGGYASACLGAGSPVVGAALSRAVEEAGYVTDEIHSWERSKLLELLFRGDGLWAEQFPADEYHVAGRNSGSEGMEMALRLALESRFDHRRLQPAEGRGHRDIVLAFEGAWHGWTGGLLPLLNKRHYRIGLPSVAPEPYGFTVRHIPFGQFDAAREFFARHGDRVLAVVIEPVQGDAGIIVPPAGYLREVARLCTDSGALLVADEVLTFAKTGQFFGMADENGPIPTDVSVVGKSLGMGALSTSMVIARRNLTVRATGAISTSDLRPLTCAVIRAGLEHIQAEGMLEKSRGLGEHVAKRLDEELVTAFPELYTESRGSGVMHGVELTQRVADRLGEFRETMIRSGVFVEFMGGAGRRSGGLRYVFPTMRVAPPIVSTLADADAIVERLAAGSRSFLEVSA